MDKSLEENTQIENNNVIETSDSSGNNKQLVGVGGWLLFFCFGLVVLNPILRVGGVLSGYKDSSIYFDKLPSLEVLFYIELAVALFISLFSVYSGLMLYWKRPNAISITKMFLLSCLIAVLLEIISIYLIGLPDELISKILPKLSKDIFRMFVYVGVWHSYLNKSIRVKNTYGVFGV